MKSRLPTNVRQVKALAIRIGVSDSGVYIKRCYKLMMLTPLIVYCKVNCVFASLLTRGEKVLVQL